jgi:hypothetical protein
MDYDTGFLKAHESTPVALDETDTLGKELASLNKTVSSRKRTSKLRINNSEIESE